MNARAYRPLNGLAACALLAAIVSSTGCQMATSGHNVSGVRLYQTGQYQAAAEKFQQAIASNPKSGDAYYNYAATLHAMGKAKGNDSELLKEAETFYNKCIDYDRDHVEAHRALGVLLAERGEPERQFTLMKNWAASSPMIASPRIELARLYEEYGDMETAKKHLDEALMIDPKNSRVLTALGRLREKMGDSLQAMQNYQQALAANPMQPELAARVASLQQRMNAAAMAAGNGSGETRFVSAPTTTVKQ